MDNLKKLYQLLVSNNYLEDAKRLSEIISDVEVGASEMTKKRIVAMCNPKYLGDYNIKEFENVYEWWNFLSQIKSEVEEMN